MDLGVSGLASGFDWRSLVDQLSDIERVPQQRLRTEQQQLRSRNTAFGSLATELKTLQTKITSLNQSGLFESRSATVDDATAARATAAEGAVQGTFTLQFNQLATAARQLGVAGAGRSLSATDDVSTLVLSDAGLSTPVTAGTFTVNGKQVTVATSDTLQDVFDKISSATGGTVTARYDAVSDTVRLSSASTIVLGSATDSSNFLRVSKLNNSGTGSIASAGPLGSVRLASPVNTANLDATVSDGGSGQGQFRINGVDIAWSAAESLSDVLKRINESAAGVTASYDTVNDRFVLANKTTGDVGIALEDVTGNFLAATRLQTGTLERGKDLLYTVNGGGQLRSQSNTITEDTSGLAGLSVTAVKEGATAVVTVSGDTAKMKSAITEFIDQYNKVQSLIDTQTTVSTASDGKVTAAVLASESEVGDIASRLRSLTFGSVTGLGSTLDRLEKLGYDTNSEDNRLTLDDPELLDRALQDNASSVSALFTNTATGLAGKLDKYLAGLVGDDGSLVSRQSTLTRQASEIDTQVTDMERLVQSRREAMIASFVSMEKAQAQISQQLQFLQQRFK